MSIKIENAEVMGWEAAIRGMRNPMNSWEKSDSNIDDFDENCGVCKTCLKLDMCGDGLIGPNDLGLMTRLRNAGTEHRKFMRMITVHLDITAPLYWWKEFDTYKIGTIANSCSTMHKIHAKEFTPEDFSHEHLMDFEEKGRLKFSPLGTLQNTINELNDCRKVFLETNNKEYWWQMIQLLPTSYNQKRTVMLNYEVLTAMYNQRKNHKLDEWRSFCSWIETLPYHELITGQRSEEKESEE